jgi:formyl-CoA transferase
LSTATGHLLMPGLVPSFSRTPGSVREAGPPLGRDTDEILRTVLGYDDDRLASLREAGVV